VPSIDRGFPVLQLAATAQFENVGAWGQTGDKLTEIVKAGTGGPGCGPGKVGVGDGVVAMLNEDFGSGGLGSWSLRMETWVPDVRLAEELTVLSGSMLVRPCP
jgi:hypothetical protein